MSIKMNIKSIGTAVAFAAVSSLAAGQLAFTSQSRGVSAVGPNGGTPSAAAASDFGPFVRSVSSNGPQGGIAAASQNSVLGAFSISAAGSANPGKYLFAGIFGSANSSCTVGFIAASTQTFTLSGTFNYATASLSGPGVNISLSGSSSNVSQIGTFQAGASYTFQVATSGLAHVGDPPVTGDFNLQLAIVSVPLGSAFTYQGVARKDGAPINGPTDFEFALYSLSVGGVQIGSTQAVSNVPVSNGVFTQRLDFDPVFDGLSKWLEVRVRNPAGSGSFTTVSPRTQLDATPYALFAATAPWGGVTGVPANVAGAFSPWQPISGGIGFWGGLVSAGGVSAELSLNAATGLKIGSGGMLAFGTIGDTLGSAENTDLIAFKRVNPMVGTANQSELRLYLGDDPTVASNSQDYFTIGTIPGGTWTQTFGFRSDGLASKPGGGAWANISDPRTKHDVLPLKGTLDRLLSLRGYQYFYNDDEVKKGRALPGVQIGLMADEVEQVFPDWVTRDRDGMRMVTERSTTALMVEALRDLRREKDQVADEAQREIEKLREQNAALEERLRKLEAKLNR